MRFHIITLFPEMFDSYLKESILGRAIREKKIKISFINPRKFVTGKYKKVWPDGNISAQADDRPYGGGPGMVMRAEPVLKAVEFIQTSIAKKMSKARTYSNFSRPLPLIRGGARGGVLVVNFVPSAEKFTTTLAKKFSKNYTDIIMICGRYEGIDARVEKILRQAQDKSFKFERLSVGDYILTGGEIPAMVLIDSISRQVKGVLGNFDSREEERISSSEVYTRPEVLKWPLSSKTSAGRSKNYRVPKVLLGGNHKEIENWKQNKK